MEHRINITEAASSLIASIIFEDTTDCVTIIFRKYYVEELTYFGFSQDMFIKFINSKSFGRFYLSNIKNNFSTKQKSQKMADKIIKLKIDTKKINKDWLFVGEKGTYLNVTLLYNEKEDSYGNCGMIVQDVPTEVYKKDKTQKGAILGNGKEFEKQAQNAEAAPGTESGKIGLADEIADDLPF